jgi:hypothetical protein
MMSLQKVIISAHIRKELPPSVEDGTTHKERRPV